MSTAESAPHAARRLDGLYRAHASDVYRFAYAVLGNRSDAEDVTQTTFVNALRALERGEQPRKPDTWLLVIAHNLVRQRWRHAASRPAEVQLVSDVPAAVHDDEQHTMDEVVHALQRIPPTQREALVMRELEGRSYAEISELLGLTTSALETLLFRARRSLADELENLVTCERAELDLTRQLDGRLGRKERRRLEEHLATCQPCAERAASYKRHRRALSGLAVLPVPLGATFAHGAPAHAAATLGLVKIGGAAGGAASGATGGIAVAGAASGGAAGGVAASSAGGVVASGAGGLGLLGTTAAKIAAVVVAGSVATGVGVKGVERVVHDSGSRGSTKASTVGPTGASGRPDSQGKSTATAGRGRKPTPTSHGQRGAGSAAAVAHRSTHGGVTAGTARRSDTSKAERNAPNGGKPDARQTKKPATVRTAPARPAPKPKEKAGGKQRTSAPHPATATQPKPVEGDQGKSAPTDANRVQSSPDTRSAASDDSSSTGNGSQRRAAK